MKILHITPTSNGYEEVELLANRISRKNHLALIVKDGKKCMTGGHLIHDTPDNRSVLDSMPRECQYDFVTMFKYDPFVKEYADLEEKKNRSIKDKTAAERVLEWMKVYYAVNGTPNFGEIVAQLEMAIEEVKEIAKNRQQSMINVKP